MAPHGAQEWLADRLGQSPPGGRAGHHAADQLLHLGYGAAWGALSAPLLAGRDGRRSPWRGTASGLGMWAIGMLAAFPLLRVAPPAWRAGAIENATNIAAHVIYALALQRLAEEPPRQTDRQRTSDAERSATRVG
jgi:hypothetical protein